MVLFVSTLCFLYPLSLSLSVIQCSRFFVTRLKTSHDAFDVDVLDEEGWGVN
jgi:hypothetical protein